MKKKKLDLYKLFTLVVQKGGAALVTDRRLWAAIVSELGVQDINRSSSRLRDQWVFLLYPAMSAGIYIRLLVY